MKTFYCAAKKSYKNVLGGVFAGLALAFTALLFTGCENFLKGEDVQQEIKNVIEYNNAPSYVINVETLTKNDGEIKTPATHEIEKKVTDVFPIRFEPYEDHKFIEWEAIIKDLNAGEKASDYIVFEDPKSLETNVTFKKASSKVIIIRPICPPRLTYTFKQGDGDIYPRDSSIEFTFNPPISEACFPVNSQVAVENYVTIQGLDGTEVQKYYKPPRVNDKKLVFNSDISNGWIPIQNLQRSISVKIDKDKIWYVNNKDYSKEVKIYLDEDIKVSFNINSETSKKTNINYQVRVKDDDKPVGTLKIDGEEIKIDGKENKIDGKEKTSSKYSYSVGQQVSLRFKLDEGYTFYGWAFKKNGEPVALEDLSITFGDEDYANNLVQTTFTVDNYTEDVITIIPQVYDPVKVKFVKGAEGSGSLKANTTTIVQDEQSFDFAVGSSFSSIYKVAEGYYFNGWNFERTYKDSTGAEKTEPVAIDELEDYGLILTKDDDADENGYDKNTRIAQINLAVEGYTDNTISITPVCYENLKITKFNLDDNEKFYERDNDITIEFNKQIVAACKDKITIKIPNLPEGKTVDDYFEPAVISGKVYTRKAKQGAIASLVPVGQDGTNTITITINAAEVYYEVPLTASTGAKVGLSADATLSYKINSETVNKTKIKFHQNDILSGKGSLKVDDVSQDEQTLEYSIGKSFVLKYKLSNDYKFYGWKFTRTYKDEAGQNQTEEFDAASAYNLKLSMKYEEGSDIYGFIVGSTGEGQGQATITVNGYVDGVIQIEPVVSVIPVGTVILEDNNGKISSNNGRLANIDGVQVKIAETKKGDENIISFSPDAAYEFIKWQIYDRTTGTVYENKKNDYITLADDTIENTSYKLLDVPSSSSNIQLAIKPIVAERPQILDCTPSSTGTTLLRKDSTIQIIFDYDMDEGSIYYTGNELQQVRALIGLADDEDENVTTGNKLLKSSTSENYYGYIKDGYTYYKNISIRNNNVSAANPLSIITEHFNEPKFDNPRTLTIGVQRGNEPQSYIQILVNVGKIDGEIGDGFFYKKDDKVVSMSGYKRWIYRINDDTDILPPHFNESNQFKLRTKEDAESNLSTTSPVLDHTEEGLGAINYISSASLSASLYLDLNLLDTDASNQVGSGLASNFIVTCKKIYDNKYAWAMDQNIVSNYIVDYQSNDASTGASYKGLISLANLDEGLYSVKLTFRDQSGNEFTEPSEGCYYFCYDNTSPFTDIEEDENPLTVTDADDVNNKLKLAWNASAYKDLKESEIKFKKHNEETFEPGNTVSSIAYNTNYQWFDSLDCGTLYDFQITYKDYAGNKNTFDTSAYTRPATPEDVVIPATPYGTSATINGNKPDAASYDNIQIRYREKDTVTWTTTSANTDNISDSTGGFQISGLGNGKTYEFEVCSYDSLSGKYSIPFKNASNQFPTFATIPSAVTITSSRFSSSTTSGEITFTSPSSNYTEIVLQCSTESNFPDDASKTKTLTFTKSNIGCSATVTKTFTGLTSGTYYYARIRAWYDAQDNYSEHVRPRYSTKPSPVTDLVCSAKDRNSLTLSWTKPVGNYSSYTLSYKIKDATSWTPISILDSDKSISSYKIENLTAGTSYNVQIVANSNGLSSNVAYLNGSASSSEQLYPNPATGLTVTKGSNITTANISWTKPTGNYTKLILYLSRFADFSSTTTYEYVYSDTTTSKTYSSIITGDTYYFKIKTYISDTLYTETAVTSYSSDIEAVTEAYLENYGSNKINICFKLPTTNYQGVKIYRDDNITTPIATLTYATLQKSYYNATDRVYKYPDTNLTPNKSYKYRIDTYKDDKNAPYEIGSLRTNAGYATWVSAETQSSTSVKLTWTNPSNQNYWDSTYIYKKKSGGEEEIVAGWTNKTTTTYTVSNLDPGTAYSFYIYTSNNDGVKDKYLYKSATTYLAPVTNVTCVPNSTTSVKLTWTKPAGLYDEVRIHYKEESATDYTYYTYYTTGTSCTISGLSASKTYNIKIETYKNGLTSHFYECLSFTKPNAPSLSVDSHTTTSVTLKVTGSWYKIYYKPHSSSTWTASSSKTISGLTSGIKYDFYARAVYYTTSNSSDSTTISCITDLATPSGVYATVKEGDIIVHWTKPSGNENYFKVYYQKNGDSSWSNTGWRILGSGATQTTLTGLTASTKYNFKVQSNYDYSSGDDYYSSNNDNCVSSESDVCSLYTPPAPVTNMSLWSDDLMGTVIVRYKPSVSTNSVDVFVNDVYKDTGSKTTDDEGYCYWKVEIPYYKRGGTYTINIRAYHRNNSTSNNAGENYFTRWPDNTLSKSCTVRASTDTWLLVNGKSQSCRLENVTKSNVSITKNDASSSSAFYGSGSGTITLTPYSIGAWEICQTFYQDIMGNNPSKVQQQSGYAYPVTNISWYAAIAFCNKLSVLQGLQPCYEISGFTDNDWKDFTYSSLPPGNSSTWNAAIFHFDRNGYHLPTEWQWEFAARGGDPDNDEWNYTYSGSNTATNVGWVESNSDGTIHGATTKTKNRLGLFDMTGNASEWLSDWYYSRTKNSTSYTDPYVQYNGTSSNGPVRSNDAIIYKNTKYSNNNGLKSWDWWSPSSTFDYMGFRICRNVTFDKN